MKIEEAEALGPQELERVLQQEVKAKRAALAEALARSSLKPVARAAKKALYQLKSSGVAVTEEAPKGEQPQVRAEKEEFPALLSAIAGTGERAVFIARARQGGGLETFQAVIDDEQGLLSLERGDAQRSKYRRHLEQLRQEEVAVIEVPLARALEELGIAWATNAQTKNPLPGDADSLLRRLGVVAIERRADLPPLEPTDAPLAERAGALHDQREIIAWLPGDAQLQVLGARLEEVDASPLQLSEAQKQEQRLQKAVLTSHEVSAAERKVWAHRLWHTAELFAHQGRKEHEALARAAAKQLFHQPGAPSRFLEKMFEKVVVLSQRAQAEQAQTQAGAAPVAPEKTSPGGLIIP